MNIAFYCNNKFACCLKFSQIFVKRDKCIC